MSLQPVAAALHRVKRVLERRPDTGLHDDAPASARWERGVRSVASHANGTRIETDMSTEVGGTGDRVTPGWLFRAGIASCAVTTIAMRAAAEGIELSALEAHVGSRTDMRGILDMPDVDGTRVPAGPREVHLRIRVAADGVAPERLRAIVERACGCSPIPSAVADATPLDVQIDIG